MSATSRGIYWLAVLKSKPFACHFAFEAPEETLSATDTIESGYLVVKAQWLKLEKKNCEGGVRSYTLLDSEILLVVNHMDMVSLSGLHFSSQILRMVHRGGSCARDKGGRS